jgi:pyruvate/2-oxoacid:ferredoxin oxidoreductase beta subunit
MDKFSLYVSNFLPVKEYFTPEKNNACPGCGLALAVRQTYKALEKDIKKASWQPMDAGEQKKGIQDVLGVGNTELSFLKIPKAKAHLVVCLDNEAGGTLNDTLEKPMPSLAVAEGFSYVATASPSYPFDLFDKLKRGLESEGNAYIHILCPCPQEWKFDPDLTVKMGMWAVESRAFPLYESGGGMPQLTVVVNKPRPLEQYLKVQKRFDKLSSEECAQAQVRVDSEYNKLVDSFQSYLEATGSQASVSQ